MLGYQFGFGNQGSGTPDCGGSTVYKGPLISLNRKVMYYKDIIPQNLWKAWGPYLERDWIHVSSDDLGETT